MHTTLRLSTAPVAADVVGAGAHESVIKSPNGTLLFGGLGDGLGDGLALGDFDGNPGGQGLDITENHGCG